jgi:deazaflavin-dependent oxidoreductase (nitroreductase family)
LRAHPEASVEIGRERHPVVAHRVTGPERDRLWQKMIDAYADYNAYQAKTTRQLPVVKLERR